MRKIKHLFVYLRRITHCRGFGIQSPTDYWLVRYVINEHWPYYQYDMLGEGDDWLTRKLGLLYFRISNWRQPIFIESDNYREYLQAGCRKAFFGDSSEMIILSLIDDYSARLSQIYDKARNDTVLIVDGIQRDRKFWKEIVKEERARVTFDLYYCGIVFFDKKRHKQNYIINF